MAPRPRLASSAQQTRGALLTAALLTLLCSLQRLGPTQRFGPTHLRCSTYYLLAPRAGPVAAPAATPRSSSLRARGGSTIRRCRRDYMCHEARPLHCARVAPLPLAHHPSPRPLCHSSPQSTTDLRTRGPIVYDAALTIPTTLTTLTTLTILTSGTDPISCVHPARARM